MNESWEKQREWVIKKNVWWIVIHLVGNCDVSSTDGTTLHMLLPINLLKWISNATLGASTDLKFWSQTQNITKHTIFYQFLWSVGKVSMGCTQMFRISVEKGHQSQIVAAVEQEMVQKIVHPILNLCLCIYVTLWRVYVWVFFFLSVLWMLHRSRLADYKVNCWVTPQTVSTCPNQDNHQACLASYARLIGQSSHSSVRELRWWKKRRHTEMHSKCYNFFLWFQINSDKEWYLETVWHCPHFCLEELTEDWDSYFVPSRPDI